MKTENFNHLIRLITGRDLTIDTNDDELYFDHEYMVFRRLPITGRKIYFNWKTPKAEDKMLRSFITAFTSKYREPDPSTYNHEYGGRYYTWDEKTPEEKEYAYYHHFTHMFNKEDLLKQIEDNFKSEGITSGLLRYGFYETLYGIGIFCFWMTAGVNEAILKMKQHLNNRSIPFSNEFSDAKWVYRFKIGLTKEAHLNLIRELNTDTRIKQVKTLTLFN